MMVNLKKLRNTFCPTNKIIKTIDYSLQASRKVTLVSLISDLDLGDLNYLLSVKPTLDHQGQDGLLWTYQITRK